MASAGVKAMAMGSASRGPIYLGGGTPLEVFVDLKTLKPLAITQAGQRLTDSAFKIRAAANGRVFGTWALQRSPTGVRSVVLKGNTATSFELHNSAGTVIPGPDGSVIYTGRGKCTQEARPLGDLNKNGPSYLPAVHGDFFLTVPWERPEFAPKLKPAAPQVIALHFGENKLADLPQLEVPQSIGGPNMDLDKRLHLIPDANLIITIPSSHDRLVLQRVDAWRILENSGIDYLIVNSPPRGVARKHVRLSSHR